MGLGGSTVYRMVVKPDGSPNWPGIVILITVLTVMFVWRCMVFIQEHWVGVRLRFNRVVRDNNGMPIEYDPLKEEAPKPIKRRQVLRRLRVSERWRKLRGKPPKVPRVSGVRFRFYMFNSIRLVNCGDRETDLGIDAITLRKHDFMTSIAVEWNVSRDPGCPTKSILKPAESSWRWRTAKEELESLVKRKTADATLRAYEKKESELGEGELSGLPLLTIKDVEQVKKTLYDDYGVNVSSLLYGQRSTAPARRTLEAAKMIADALREVASSIRSRFPLLEQSNSDDQETDEESRRLAA